jgi:hypothetical protein
MESLFFLNLVEGIKERDENMMHHPNWEVTPSSNNESFHRALNQRYQVLIKELSKQKRTKSNREYNQPKKAMYPLE